MTEPLMVDINCDMGESFGAFSIGDDAQVIPFITSANVACGFHGGDPRVMAATIELAKRHGVAIGAHPGFPDLVGFGRRDLSVSPDDARTDVLYQIGAVHAFLRAASLPLQHVKPHGQLNNQSITDRALADAIVSAVYDFDPHVIIMAYGGELVRAAEARHMSVGYEVFADREYMPDGSLVPRSHPRAVIHDVEHIVRRAVDMVRDRCVIALSGETIPLQIDTICVHGDTPGAGTIARALRVGLETAGITVRPLHEVIRARDS